VKEANMGLMGRDILDRVAELKAAGQPFALATVVRTVAVTAAKAGAKAVIRPDGTISEGWIGGGCARGAVLRAAKDALADGQPRLSMCPSRGTMDIFIEPVMPRPEVIILGTSPVGLAVADLAPRFGFDVTGCAIGPDLDAFPIHAKRIDGFALPGSARGYVLVATQGRGDEAALRAALAVPFVWTAFVGSRAKMAALRDRLADADPARLAAVEAPAGLDIGAITPDEIALSILARMVAHRRQGQRG
jgi:xanthine dehydrogenase accessory factor